MPCRTPPRLGRLESIPGTSGAAPSRYPRPLRARLLPLLAACTLPAMAGAAEPLLVHVGGTMRPAMEELCGIFEKETGIKVELNYNDSGALLTTLRTTGKGDALVVHDPFPAQLEKEGAVDRSYTLAALTPVIVVPKGNPKNIKTIQDLARPGLKVALTDAMYSTAGHIVTRAFEKAGIAKEMAAKEVVRARGGGEVANAVKLGTVDAAIAWDAVVFERRSALDAVAIAPAVLPDSKADAITTATYGVIDMSCTKVVLMTLKQSKRLDDARKLADLAASARGQAIFAAKGFSPVRAAAPAAKLSGALFVYCAAGVKEPIAELARLFEAETGVKVETTFANSGQLLGQIETTRIGDVYIPGDVDFANRAKARNLVSGEPRTFCYFVPALYVRKGNPKGIKDITDLVRPGLKLALADPSAAIGKLQLDIFKRNAMSAKALKENTVVSPATVTDVALAVKLGTADAGLIWDALQGFAPDEAEIVKIPLDKNVIGVVAACALAGAKNPAAAGAFVDFLATDKARTVLRAKHFTVEHPVP